MADNFNLRQFLTENKLTKNAKLLKEEKFYAPNYIAQKYGAKAKEIEQNIYDAEEAENNPNLWDHFTSLETPEEVDTFIQGFIEEDLDEEASQGSDISGYWIMYGEPNKGLKQFIKMFPSQEEAQQALEDAPAYYGQHVLRSNWGIEPAQDWLASGKELGPDLMGHPDRVRPRQLSPEEKAQARADFNDLRQNMYESKLTPKERKLVKLVENALGIQKEEKDQYGYDPDNEEFEPEDDYPGQARYVSRRDIEEGEEMVNEKPLPKYENIEKLMQEIEHGTNEAAYKHKMAKMKEVAEMLEKKCSALEEGEGADFVDAKKVKQMKKDIMTLRKQADKLEKEYDKKFTKKEAKKEPVKESKLTNKKTVNKMENFNLKKFLVENKLTTNSRMVKEYIEADEESVTEAFQQAGIELTQPVYVVEARSVGAGGQQDKPYKVLARQLLRTLEKKRVEYNNDETGVQYDYDAAETYPAEESGLPENISAKLAVMFGDEYEYVIFQ